jgi:hypothetical protein
MNRLAEREQLLQIESIRVALLSFVQKFINNINPQKK